MEVILQNLGGQSWTHGGRFGIHCSYYFAAADYLGGRESGDFCGQYQVDFYLHIRSNHFLGTEEQARTADVLGRSCAPFVFSELAIAQRQMQVETLCAERRNSSAR